MPAVKTKGIHAPLEISPALAKIIGTEEGERLTRGQVVKKLYAYIKDEGLQDAEYKMYFKPDKTMEPVFGDDTLRMYVSHEETSEEAPLLRSTNNCRTTT